MDGFTIRIAIVGFGPRGLGALEALIAAVRPERAELRVDIFDPSDFPGAGPNFSPAEDPLCLLNLPVRDIDLPAPGRTPMMPGFRDWLTGADAQPDRFPPRAVLGAYLTERYARLVAVIEPGVIVTHHRALVSRIEQDERGWLLQAGDHLSGPYDEVLLSLGQPRSKPDDQLAAWRRHAERSGADLASAYPGHNLVAASRAWANRTVAVRGLGLATLDVVRLLTLGHGGKFVRGRYVRSGREPQKIVPFSLDGQPPAPKPATGAIDARYDLTPNESAAVGLAIEEAMTLNAGEAVRQIADAVVFPARRILTDLGYRADFADLRGWFATELASPGAQEDLSGAKALVRNIAIARGEMPPTIGYAVGQIWRKSQSQLRAVFDCAEVESETAAAIVAFDEGLKRYSYGPPVGAADQLRMLIEAGVVTLSAADDPDVRTIARGWQLHEGRARIVADVMIDAVIPSPRLDQTEDPAFRSLIRAERISAVHASLGVRVAPDGTIPGTVGLAVTGRMASGSVIGTDSIHDCFGAPVERWAAGVVARAKGRQGQDAGARGLCTAI